jgi:elongation factor P
MQYLYENSGEYMFMDSQTYEQIQINADGIGDAKWYLKEQEEYQILFLNGRAISLELPAAVILKVIETEPSARGDTVSNITKPATLDGGLEVKVPPFIKVGDMVKVDTRTGEYLERSN